MVTLLWHRFRLRVGPFFWHCLRRRPRLRAWIARISPELRFTSRCGRLKGDRDAQRSLETRLLALDIIVNRGSPKLSDDLIPGYFNHAAVYLGRELAGELVLAAAAAGHPAPARDRDCVVLEASRSGVRLVSLSEFLDVDSLAVLRVGPASGGARRRFVERAARELGKEYDFAFDLTDSSRQYCCKLVSRLFPDLPSADIVGVGASLVPDDFVLPSLTGGPGAPHLAHLIHDGAPVPADQREEALAQLLRDGCRPATPWRRAFGVRRSDHSPIMG